MPQTLACTRLEFPQFSHNNTSSPDPKRIEKFDAADKHMVKPSGYHRKNNQIPELLGFTPKNLQPPKAPTTVDASPFRREIIPFPLNFCHMPFLHWLRPSLQSHVESDTHGFIKTPPPFWIQNLLQNDQHPHKKTANTTAGCEDSDVKKWRGETQTDPELQFRSQGIAPTLAATAPSPWLRHRNDLNCSKINPLECPVLLLVSISELLLLLLLMFPVSQLRKKLIMRGDCET